jgi:signal transduction histidine kinase/CheY-like chemotaxis protein
MRLPTRLLALILLCVLPVIAAEIYTNADLRSRQQAELSTLAMRQSVLANGDMGSLVDGAKQLMRTIAQFPGVRALDPGCDNELQVLQQQLQAYSFLAVLGQDGAVVCSSRSGAGSIPAGELLSWANDIPEAGNVSIGRYTAMPDGNVFLPIMHMMPRTPTDRGGAIVVALDLQWLGEHLATQWLSRTRAETAVAITDRDGTVLARYPDNAAWLGRPLPDAALAFVGATGPGVATLHMPDGSEQLVAYVPDTEAPAGLAVLVFVPGNTVGSRFDVYGTREIALVAGAALLALVLTVLAGRRFFVRPMERLLQAAQRWRDGELGVRADVGETRSEFSQLAASFNEMASALQARDAELRHQAGMLEAQVAARTRALSETNNRLQVEIAEREKTEAALHQAQKLQAIGQLAGGIAHDFNNMLATVLGSLELMERRIENAAPGADPAETRRLQTLIGRATEAVQRGAQLTSRLLTFSRRQRLVVRPADLNQLIGDLVTLAGSTLGRGVRVRSDLAQDLWPALVDPSQVEAAVLNLCLNARDAMPEGGDLLIATGHETVTEAAAAGPAPGDYVRITVRDTGCGMTPAVQARAFEPFFSTKGASGTGLGLSQVYGLAHQSGGTVRLSSTPGQGTEVTLLLPRAHGPAVPSERPRPRDDTRPEDPRLLVMVVDDDAAVRQVTADMLRDLNCDVIEASGAGEALALLDSSPRAITLLLLDYMMPGQNGIDLARAVRARGIGAPLVLATGYAELGDSLESYKTLINALLPKPFTITELQAVLLRLRIRTNADGNVAALRGQMHG